TSPLSAGSHSTLSSVSAVSHFAASCSFSTSSPDLIVQKKQSGDDIIPVMWQQICAAAPVLLYLYPHTITFLPYDLHKLCFVPRLLFSNNHLQSCPAKQLLLYAVLLLKALLSWHL